MMVGKIFITRSGYDPQFGRHVKDPYLGDPPTLGACRPDVRDQLSKGDHIFVITGKVPGAAQFVMGGFEIESKIDASEAYRRFPGLRLQKRDDGQITGNIIVNAMGNQHALDDHPSFERRVKNYVVGTSPVSLVTDDEIAQGRQQTLDVLRELLHKNGNSPFDLLGRGGVRLTEKQIGQLRNWLGIIKESNNHSGVVAVESPRDIRQISLTASA